MPFDAILRNLAATGNLRTIPADTSGNALIDLSANDYLGLASDTKLQGDFLSECVERKAAMSASASRLLAASQSTFTALENELEKSYGAGRKAIMFNSGYHANTGLIPALAQARKNTVVIADRLIHASAIDGIVLSRCRFERFRHNDLNHLERLMHKYADSPMLIVVESIYSMDGDSADICGLLELKQRFPQAMLYVDEAHAIGVDGPHGLGLSAATGRLSEVDVVVGTFGKALASVGAFAIIAPEVREYLVNTCRPLIFSTALPPMNALWSQMMFRAMTTMDKRRARLKALASQLHDTLRRFSPSVEIHASHIQPLIIGDAHRTVELSNRLLKEGIKVLPIRTPTVPPGTERLRFSLSAALTDDEINRINDCLTKILSQ